jgi:hypothetical protein
MGFGEGENVCGWMGSPGKYALAEKVVMRYSYYELTYQM